MPNASELARVEGEASHEEYEGALRTAYDVRLPKGTREAFLRRARQLAEELGLPQPGPINGLSTEEALQRAQSEPQRHIRQTPTAHFLPFDGKEFLLTRGQRMVLIDALLSIGRNESGVTRDRELVEERRLLIELLHQK